MILGISGLAVLAVGGFVDVGEPVAVSSVAAEVGNCMALQVGCTPWGSCDELVEVVSAVLFDPLFVVAPFPLLRCREVAVAVACMLLLRCPEVAVGVGSTLLLASIVGGALTCQLGLPSGIRA